ncbi:MAG: branched-chain amino acid ABC transporter substrate-binding protein, partial [Alphaproteobacteria bacterium]|nr:branched-chain amino acid ABC transporter substrate-binding protein [Alphaproteobacteria bacterium]
MKQITRRTILAGAPAAIALAAPFLSIVSARAEKQYPPGVTDTEIKIGNIMPY